MSVKRGGRLWLQIVERDGGEQCVDCGYLPMQEVRSDGVDANPLTADHVVPKSQGGRTVLDNLQLRCRSCNASKGDRMPEDHEKSVRFANAVWQAGFTMVPNVVLLDGDMSMGARMVYAQLLHYAREKEEAWPGQARLAAQLGCSERSLRTYIGELEEAELIRSRRRGMGRTNVYSIPAPRPAKKRMSRPANPADQDRQETRAPERQELPPNEKKMKEREETFSLSSSVEEVLAVLREAASPEPTATAVRDAMVAFPDRDHLAVADNLVHWTEHAAKTPERLDTASLFRKFLDGADPVKRAKQQDPSAWVREHLPALDPKTVPFGYAVHELGRLRARGEPFISADVLEAAEARYERLAAPEPVEAS